jgi:DNA segregation ATPase FtsK/SpoIIIE, S-DNA-T family
MPKKSRKKAKPKQVKTSFGPRSRCPKPIFASALVLFGIMLLVAIFDYRTYQTGFFESLARTTASSKDFNLMGKLGADAGYLSLNYLGLLAFAVGLALIQFAHLLYFRRPRQITLFRMVGFALLLTAGCGFFEFAQSHFWPEILNKFPDDYLPGNAGGEFGEWIYCGILHDIIGTFGSGLSLGVFFLTGFYITFSNPLNFIGRLIGKIRIPLADLDLKNTGSKTKKTDPVITNDGKTELPPLMKARRNWLRPFWGKSVLDAKSDDLNTGIRFQENNKPSDKYLDELVKSGKKTSKGGFYSDPATKTDESSPKSTPRGDSRKKGMITIVESEKAEKDKLSTPKRKGRYQFPPIKLLEISPEETGDASTNHQLIAERLKKTLEDFKIKVELGEVHIGPVITRYDLHPAPGVRVEKISALEKNLTMALQAQSVRILAPVPGKGCVGIEIPNEIPQSVRVRDILETRIWTASKAEIPIVLGKDVSGKPLVTDLTRMPHLLIAGSTGSGKTVCINAIICSLLYHSSPEDLRFIMVDPKIVEMKIFNDLPHMLIPVVTDPKRVPNALKWLIAEMENRYQIFAKVGVRNIAGFNARILKDQESRALAKSMDAELTAQERAAVSNIEVERDSGVLEIPNKKLPYIVCIIDELADIMMVAPADVETCVARLAQLARAAGIHLIIATQRPSVNVITGIIKANLPSRISFKVASKIDSRTILDGGGADALIGRGDMLFIPPGAHHLIRAQCAYISDEEISDIVEFLKVNGPPEISEYVQSQVERDPDDDGKATTSADSEEWGDALVPDAIEVIRNSKRASTSMLQRRLRIGYNRAARIMEILENRGLVGPDNGSQPREILGDPNDF